MPPLCTSPHLWSLGLFVGMVMVPTVLGIGTPSTVVLSQEWDLSSVSGSPFSGVERHVLGPRSFEG